MENSRVAQLVLGALLGGVGLVGPAAPVGAAAPVTASVGPASTVHVSVNDCTPAADGGIDAPYCSISAAAAVAQPGQTVLVQPGSYAETVTFTRSGTESAPIVFRAETLRGAVRVGKIRTDQVITSSIFTFAGVRDVTVEGFSVAGGGPVPAIRVDDAERITINDHDIQAYDSVAGVRVTGASRDVTVSRSWFTIGHGPAIDIGAGTTGAVVTANQVNSQAGVLVTDAPGTLVTGNTLATACRVGVDVIGNSPGASVRNNIVATGNLGRISCRDKAAATAIRISAGSTSDTTVDHNLIDPISGGALYSWNGTDYTDLAGYVAATGQGTHELVANPLFTAIQGSYRRWVPVAADSPAIDSADATAPGALSSDMLGNPYTDDPAVANGDRGFRDRGAVERQGPLVQGKPEIALVPGGGLMDTAAAGALTWTWPTEGGTGSVAFQFAGQRYPTISRSGKAQYRFPRAGTACVTYWVSRDGFRNTGAGSSKNCTVVGAHYTPVSPTRLLDTRAAIGVPSTTPIPAGGEVVLSIPEIAGTPAGGMSAVVLNVTVTRPTAAGFVTVYPDGSGRPSSSNVNFVAGETVPNLVTVPVKNGRVRLANVGRATIHLVADLQGFYGPQGSGFKPLAPQRVLDTRTGPGAPVAGNADLRLDLSGHLPQDATAAILNMTVTKPTASGVLKVYPDGTPVPTASNLNFVAGQTIPNLVIVPVIAGRVLIRNASSGTTHVIADLAGYFGSAASGATQRFVPIGPIRIADTRDATGLRDRLPGPLEPYRAMRVRVGSYDDPVILCTAGCPVPTAVVANLTVTGPTAAGVLTAYPNQVQLPTASNVNYLAKETAANLTVTKAEDQRMYVYNNSPGSTHVIVDQSGYFITAS